MKLGQNFVKYFVSFLGDGFSRKDTFEIHRPLLEKFENNKYVAPSNSLLLVGTANENTSIPIQKL
jgi:hypothetical protein